MIGLEADTESVRALSRSIRNEVDGKRLLRGLAKDIRKALEPAVVEARAGIMSMDSAGLPAAGEPLRAAIARQVKAEARLSGRSAGARVRARKRGMPRDFRNAPKRTNRAAGWRHQVWGRDIWVHQVGRPDWFDGPMRRRHRELRAAVIHAMADSVRRIARKV